MLEYLTMEWNLVNMLSTLAFRKISNANYKGYINKELNEEMDSGYTPH